MLIKDRTLFARQNNFDQNQKNLEPKTKGTPVRVEQLNETQFQKYVLHGNFQMKVTGLPVC